MGERYVSSSVIITGASRGIGRHIALSFARDTGHPLILIARSLEGLKQTKTLCEEAGARQVGLICCDLSDAEEVQKINMPDDFPDPGILINNAGSYLLKPLNKTSYNEYLNQIKDNLFTAVHVTDRFLEGMKKLDRGLIINMCSMGALEGLADSGAYASSKHALLGYTRSLRAELLESNIGVTALNLGQTQSTSWEGSDVDPEKLIDPQDVGNLLVALTKMSARSVAQEIMMTPQHGRVPPM